MADDGEAVHWTERETLTTAEEEPVAADGERLAVDVNVTDIADRIDAIENEIGASPGAAEVFVVADVTVEGELDGETVTEERTDRIIVEPGRSTYAVSAEPDGSNTHEATETREVPVGPDPISGYGSLLVALLAGTAAGLVHRADQQGLLSVTETKRTHARFRRERENLDEWISPGRPPTDGDRDVVEMDGLESLVDVAIDSDRRVVESPGGDRYVVLVDDVRYEYEPPPAA